MKGFSLIELMITVAIVGILATVAIPSYNVYILKSNRLDGTSALFKLAALEERYFAQNNTYADTTAIAEVGGGTSKEGLYTLIVTVTNNEFRATALAVGTGTQAKDTGCEVLILDSLGRRYPEECW
jgi:type IV pilus assembly protein PilE